MANSVQYEKGGERFRAVFDEFNTLNTEDNAQLLQSGECVTLADGLVHTRSVQRRGGIRTLASLDVTNAASFVGFFDGQLFSTSSTQQPYIALSTSRQGFVSDSDSESTYSSIGTFQNGSSGYLPVNTTTGSTQQNTISSQCMGSDMLFFTSASKASYYWTPKMVCEYGGSRQTIITAGTATMTTGSTSVTLSSALTAQEQLDVIGAYIINTQDDEVAAYRIAGVTSSTVITIDRGYYGSRSAAASTYSIQAVTPVTVPDSYSAGSALGVASRYQGVFGSCVLNAWNRLVIGGIHFGPQPPTGVGNLLRSTKPWGFRWSGIIDSDEGTAPFVGHRAFHDDAYVLLSESYGAITDSVKMGSAVVFLQEKAITVVYGQPTFDTTGTLDASQIYTGFNPVPGSACATPYGLFFIDAVKGLCAWNAGTIPTPVPTGRSIAALFHTIFPTRLGYHDGHLFIGGGSSSSAANNKRGFLYHVPTGRWAETYGQFSFLIPGRRGGVAGDSDHFLIGYVNPTGTEYRVCTPSDVLEYPGVTLTDPDGGNVTLDVKTGVIGDPIARMRPERLWVTYKCTDGGTDPKLVVTLYGGLDDNELYSKAFTLNGDAGTVTRVIEIDNGTTAENGLSLGFTTTGDAAVVEVIRVIVEGTVEGQAFNAG